MIYDPLHRLNLSGMELEEMSAPIETASVESAVVPEFPAASSWELAAADVSDSSTSLTAGAPPRVTQLTALAPSLEQPQPPSLSDLDRYRLELDRELLRSIAYRRHVLNREV